MGYSMKKKLTSNGLKNLQSPFRKKEEPKPKNDLEYTSKKDSGMSDAEYAKYFSEGSIHRPNLEEVDLGSVKNKSKEGGSASAKSLFISPIGVPATGKALKFGISAITKPIRKTIAQKLRPFGYGDNPTGRVANLLFGDAEPGSIASDEEAGYARQYKPKEGIGAKKERQDFLSLMMTGKQEHNSLPVSEYKPTTAKNPNATYYRSYETENDIIEAIQKEGDMDKNLEELKSKYGRVLGNFKISKGEDENGKYISYYDVWDLNPYKGKSEILDTATTVGQYLAGVTPAEAYGRIYY